MVTAGTSSTVGQMLCHRHVFRVIAWRKGRLKTWFRVARLHRFRIWFESDFVPPTVPLLRVPRRPRSIKRQSDSNLDTARNKIWAASVCLRPFLRLISPEDPVLNPALWGFCLTRRCQFRCCVTQTHDSRTWVWITSLVTTTQFQTIQRIGCYATPWTSCYCSP